MPSRWSAVATGVVGIMCIHATGTDATRPSAGCGKGIPPVHPGEAVNMTLNVEGLERHFIFKIPDAYDHNTPVPFVVSFHGWRGTGAKMYAGDQLQVLADEETFAAAWPDGWSDHVSGEEGWNSWNGVGSADSPGIEGPTCVVEEPFCYKSCEARPQGCDPCDWTTCVNDVGFTEALLDSLEETFCLDRDRLYATGFSNGGMFTWQVGQSLAHRFAAVAPGGGQPFVGFVEPPDLTGGHRIAIMDFHGEHDNVCPPYGGASGGSENTKGWIYAAVSHGTRVWAEAHGCGGRDEIYRTPFDDHVTCYAHGNCEDNTRMLRCLWDGGHTWPQIPDTLTGARLVWWFFAAHPFIPPSGEQTAVPLSPRYYTHRSGIRIVNATKQTTAQPVVQSS